ncbi:MAG: tetratricopeptide repeat protein [Proteobacteria bacterium]|nr:tetratricopeptide repeat protein [Pseudomonadota bacterium]
MGSPARTSIRLRSFVVGLTLASAIGISATGRRANAQPSDEIEVGDEGSGSGGSGSAVSPGPAQPIQKDPRAAKKAFAAAQQMVAKADALVKRGKAEEAKAAYEGARVLFVEATDLGTDINYYFYLANVEDKLGKFVEAVAHYRLVLRAQSGVDPRIAKQNSAKLDEEMSKIGTVTLTVTPDGTAIVLSGEQVGVSPLPEPLVLLPGTYLFSFNAPGFQPKENELKVEAGSESERKIDLESVAIVIEKPRKVVGSEVDDQPKPRGPTMIPVYVAGGVSLALLGTSIATGLLASTQHDTFVAPDTTKTGRADARAVGKDYAHLTDALIGGAVVTAGFAAYWYVFQVRNKKPPADTARNGKLDVSKVDVVPWVQHDTSGLSVFGRF